MTTLIALILALALIALDLGMGRGGTLVVARRLAGLVDAMAFWR